MIDKGHMELLNDLQQLHSEARAGNFHDFQSKVYGAPKMALAERLRVLRNKAIKGVYDNN